MLKSGECGFLNKIRSVDLVEEINSALYFIQIKFLSITRIGITFMPEPFVFNFSRNGQCFDDCFRLFVVIFNLTKRMNFSEMNI